MSNSPIKPTAPKRTAPTFRRASAPPAASPYKGRAPLPAGQRDTAAHGADGRVRLNKLMAQNGLASRREADDWIAKGWVRVDGQVAHMGQQVRADVRIDIDRRALGTQAQQVTILLNKPLGIVSGQAEDGHRPAITLIQPQTRWAQDNARQYFHPSQLKSLVPAGRLDVDSTGLLVLTQDGRIARQLIGEDARIDKEYLVRVAWLGVDNPAAQAQASATHTSLDQRLREIGTHDAVRQDVAAVFPPERLALLRHGLRLDGQPLAPAEVDWVNPEQLRFVLREGRKRQIRRMCEQVGLKVLGLKRVRIGRILLGDLPLGQWRYLQAHESF